jgi:periplasmic protein TonB
MQVRGTSIYKPVKTRAERAASIAIVAALHAGAITALVLGLNVTFEKKFIPDIVTRILPQTPPKHYVPPPLPPIVLDRPTLPKAPEPAIDIKNDSTNSGITTAGKGPDRPFVASTRVAGIMDTHSKPPYPPMARRLGHEGVVLLKLTISPLGIISAVDIENSSGYAELDRTAVEWVKTHWRYRPATVEGHPVTSTAEASVRFSLKDFP